MLRKASCVVLAAMLTSCGGAGLGGRGGGIDPQCRGGLGETPPARKLTTFVVAATTFSDAAAEIQTGLLTACRSMGSSLGMSDSELAGEGAEGVRSVCSAVSERMRSELTAIRGAAGVNVELRARPPHCEITVDAYARCAGECDASFTPGSAEIQCEGGELRGACSAECTGRCAVDVSAACSGTCEGSCSGTCSATAEDGSCAGQCSGECHGQCVAEAHASCSGECRGGCSVAFEAPRCTGRVRPPSVSADCSAACDARLDAEASCTPGEVELVVTGGMDGDMQQRAERVAAAVRTGLGQVMLLRVKLERLRTSGEAVVRAARELPGAVQGLGPQAALCATAAVTGFVQAVGSISVSVEVSVQVSGSVSASG